MVSGRRFHNTTTNTDRSHIDRCGWTRNVPYPFFVFLSRAARTVSSLVTSTADLQPRLITIMAEELPRLFNRKAINNLQHGLNTLFRQDRTLEIRIQCLKLLCEFAKRPLDFRWR
jgi:hypothetical protein